LTRASKPEAPEAEPARETEPAVAAHAALSPVHVMKMQGGIGNAAVTRMLAQPATNTLARLVDPAAIARRVHDAIAGLGTDEEAVYAALSELNHDPALIAQVSRTYLADYGETVETAIRGDFSGAELATAMGLIRASGAADHTAIARQVHDAIAGLGTDEEGVYAALSQLNHDATAIADVARIYLAEYGETLEAAIRGDFSGSELSTALGMIGITDAPAPPEGSIAPETTATMPTHPAPRQLPMDLASGEAILTGAFGDVRRITRGSIEILDQAEFQAAYDRIYGGGPYSWDAYVAPTYGSLNGFAHEGVNYINRASAGLHTIVHEMLHNNTASDWRGVVGSRWDEGTTEVLTQEACAKVAEPAPVCYPGESPVVREAIAQGLALDDLTEAYLKGGGQAKVADWVDANCTENWAAVKGHMEANDWAAARAGLQRKP
jgi:hypothetical protein